MKIFISHKQEDSTTANQIANELEKCNVEYYLDVLDTSVIHNSRQLTNHIRNSLNQCTDIIVVMSSATRLSQWVPFEVGMAAQANMPTATFFKENVRLPEFLEDWPRLKKATDIWKYVSASEDVDQEYLPIYEEAGGYDDETFRQKRVERFYDLLKQRL